MTDTIQMPRKLLEVIVKYLGDFRSDWQVKQVLAMKQGIEQAVQASQGEEDGGSSPDTD